MDKMKLSTKEIALVSGECRAVVFDAIREGHLRTFLVGRRRFAKPKDVQAWIDFLQRESDKGHPVAYRAKAAA